MWALWPVHVAYFSAGKLDGKPECFAFSLGLMPVTTKFMLHLSLHMFS